MCLWPWWGDCIGTAIPPQTAVTVDKTDGATLFGCWLASVTGSGSLRDTPTRGEAHVCFPPEDSLGRWPRQVETKQDVAALQN